VSRTGGPLARESQARPAVGFGKLEVSQVRVADPRPPLVFTCHPDRTPQREIVDPIPWNCATAS
jgi:hypothetical protein